MSQASTPLVRPDRVATSQQPRGLLCVDLDGTLVATDTLDECLLCMLRTNPLSLLATPFWLLRGKSYFKERVAQVAARSLGPFPYRESVVQYITEQAGRGDEVVLVTAANQRIADVISGELEYISKVIASDGETNLHGKHKLAAIQQYAADRPFDYIGDHRNDIPVWLAARQAIVVGGSSRLLQQLHGAREIVQIAAGKSTVRDWLRQLRVHQWSKNLLLVLPLVLAHQITSLPAVVACLVGVVAFSLCASAVYICNDLIDLAHDRKHPSKRSRPLAAGVISIRQAVAATVGLLTVALALAAVLLPPLFVAMLAGYFVMSLLYSLRLKRVAVLDVLLLAFFYVYRVLIGAVAIDVAVSVWLLAFSMFFFLALGMIKRFSDLAQTAEGEQATIPGRSYSAADLEFMRTFGSASTCVAILVLALYLQSDEVTRLYNHPQLLWLVCPLVFYWSMRAWMIAGRGKMPDDPIVFALRDRVSYLVGALAALLVILAAL